MMVTVLEFLGRMTSLASDFHILICGYWNALILSHVVDDLECFILIIFVEFMVACGETGLSSQTR